MLSGFAFPGNVRQLENICHWLTVMGPGQRIEAADLPPELRTRSATADEESNWQQALDRELASALARGERAVGDRLEKEFERTLILRALAHTGRPSHGSRAVARLGPQHAYAQDSGAQAGHRQALSLQRHRALLRAQAVVDPSANLDAIADRYPWAAPRPFGWWCSGAVTIGTGGRPTGVVLGGGVLG